MICTKCGSELSNDSIYCNKCGNKVIKEKDNGVFAYLCPICKTPNPNSVTYCVKCGHWLLDSNFSAIPLTKKEYYKHLEGNKKRSLIFPIILYILFTFLLIAVPIEAKVLLSLVIILYGIVNIIIPIKGLLINRRFIGFIIFFIGILAVMISSVYYSNNTYNLPNSLAVINISEYKSQCVRIIYDNLARDTKKYINNKAKFTGQIIQVQESGNNLILRVNITKTDFKIYKDTIWVNYTLKSGEKHFLENDVINLWGTVKGRKIYKAVLGNQITIPEIDAVIIEINNKSQLNKTTSKAS